MADHGVETGKQFRDRASKALACQFSERPVKRGELECKVARMGAVGLARRHRLSWLHPQHFLAGAHPEREVRKPRQPLELDLWEIAKPRHGRVEQRCQYA